MNDKHVYFEPFIAFICENEDTTDDEYNLLYQLFELLQRNNCLDTSFLFLALMFAYGKSRHLHASLRHPYSFPLRLQIY